MRLLGGSTAVSTGLIEYLVAQGVEAEAAGQLFEAPSSESKSVKSGEEK